jgi:AraC-like DNA-binding protein
MNPQSVNTNHPCPGVRPLGALSGWQERRAKELMLRDMGSCVRISAIAEHCNLSRSHFSRAFKKVTGHSPQGWLVMMKMRFRGPLAFHPHLQPPGRDNTQGMAPGL